MPDAQSAGLLNFRTERSASEVRRQYHEAFDEPRLQQFMRQGAEAADRNADQPDRLVALVACGREHTFAQALDKSLVVVIGNVGVDQHHIRRVPVTAHCADKALMLEFFRLKKCTG